jgi:Uma2 family endonuclease
MDLSAKLTITPQEYLLQERIADIKSEYLNGEIFAMAGASREHNQIASNVVRLLGNQLLASNCSVYANDMKVRIASINKYTYPDILVSCDPEEFIDEQQDVLLNPLVIIEILSDSTEAYDRGRKFFHYQHINSLIEYILISQNICSVEIFQRQNDNSWLYSAFHHSDDIVAVNSIECSLALKEIYRRVKIKTKPTY